MAQLVREVMEKANTLDEAVEIMRKGPRTCEYYYVDRRRQGEARRRHRGDARRRSKSFKPGRVRTRACRTRQGRRAAVGGRPVRGAGPARAGRLRQVRRRVSAIELMSRPVCMTSNIQSVLFAPDTLDFWVANADAKNVASHTRFTHYNLKDLLKPDETASADKAQLRAAAR